MMDGFIGNLIRRNNQRLLAVPLLLLALVVLFFGYNHSYFLGFFAGPHAVTAQQFSAAATPRAFANPFLVVSADATPGSTHSTELREVERRNGDVFVRARFLDVLVDGRHMLVRVAPGTDLTDAALAASTQQTGEIKSVSDLLHNRSLDGGYSYQGQLSPLYLDTYDYKGFGYVTLALGCIALAFAGYMLWRWSQVSGDLTRHPLCRQLAKQGQLESLLHQIDSEMAAPQLTLKRRTSAAYLTPHWLVTSCVFTVSAMQLSSVVWIYRSLVKRRIYFFITISKRYLLIAHDAFGQKLAVQLSDAQTRQLDEHLRIATPRAVHGYNKRLLSLWRRTAAKEGFPSTATALLNGQPLADQRVANQYGG